MSDNCPECFKDCDSLTPEGVCSKCKSRLEDEQFLVDLRKRDRLAYLQHIEEREHKRKKRRKAQQRYRDKKRSEAGLEPYKHPTPKDKRATLAAIQMRYRAKLKKRAALALAWASGDLDVGATINPRQNPLAFYLAFKDQMQDVTDKAKTPRKCPQPRPKSYHERFPLGRRRKSKPAE